MFSYTWNEFHARDESILFLHFVMTSCVTLKQIVAEFHLICFCGYTSRKRKTKTINACHPNSFLRTSNPKKLEQKCGDTSECWRLKTNNKNKSRLEYATEICSGTVLEVMAFLIWSETWGQKGKIHSHGHRTSAEETCAQACLYVCVFCLCNKIRRLNFTKTEWWESHIKQIRI